LRPDKDSDQLYLNEGDLSYLNESDQLYLNESDLSLAARQRLHADSDLKLYAGDCSVIAAAVVLYWWAQGP
jgi:hypothetical protein